MIKNKGFTLIELMVTVAIVGILAAVALPAYQDYTIRSQVTEGLSLAAGAKVSVFEYYANHGAYPTSNAQLGYSGASGKYVSEVNIGTDGIVVATFGNEANDKLKGRKVLLSPSIGFNSPIAFTEPTLIAQLTSLIFNDAMADDIGWGCFGNVPQKYLPTTCISAMIDGDNTVTPVDPTNPDVDPVDPTPPVEPTNPTNPTTPTDPTTPTNPGTGGGGNNGGTNPPVEPPPVVPANPYEQREDFAYSSGVKVNKDGTLTEASGVVRQPTGVNPDGSISYAFNKLYPDGLLVKSTGYFLTVAQKSAYPDLQAKYNTYKSRESQYNSAGTTAEKNRILALLRSEYQALENAMNKFGTNIPVDYPSLPTKY